MSNTRWWKAVSRHLSPLCSPTRPAPGADDVEPWVVANALMGVQRSLIDYTRTRIVAGVRNPRLAREVRAQGKRALQALESGLGRYGCVSSSEMDDEQARRYGLS